MAGIFDDIRSACAYVADNADYISINDDALTAYPDRLPLSLPSEDFNNACDMHLFGRGDDTLRFFVVLDAINFGSGYFPFLKKEPLSGYYTIASHLTEYCKQHGVPDAKQLSTITANDCHTIFKQGQDSPYINELMQLFAQCWNELGHWALNKYDGDLLGFLKQSHSAADAVEALTAMEAFQDVSYYNGKRIPILKRAQIMIQDIKLAEPDHPLIQFRDINDLTIFADNLVPYVLRCDGVFSYASSLDKKIERGELIPHGSKEEVELRACTVHAIERLAEITRGKGMDFAVRDLDFILWNRGQDLKTQTNRKRHRTQSIYY